jgi:DNA-binding XRE family transcriptional regulator
MERQEFNEALKTAGLTKKVFGEMVRIEYQTINAWGSSGRAIPSWVRPFLECQSKSKAFEIIANKVDEVRGIHGVH